MQAVYLHLVASKKKRERESKRTGKGGEHKHGHIPVDFFLLLFHASSA